MVGNAGKVSIPRNAFFELRQSPGLGTRFLHGLSFHRACVAAAETIDRTSGSAASGFGLAHLSCRQRARILAVARRRRGLAPCCCDGKEAVGFKTTISTRRLCALPSGVSFESTG